MHERVNLFDPFQANVPFLYPLKILENQMLSDVLEGIKRDHCLEIG